MRSLTTNISVQVTKRRNMGPLLSTAVISMIALGAGFVAFSQTGFAGAQRPVREPAIACEQLAAIKLKDVSSITARSLPAGAFTPPGSAAINDLPAFCRVSLVIKPQINIEVWLPMAWNERFQAVGGGGYAGSVSWAALGNALRNGYATASTDTGHNAATQQGGSFALNSDGTLNTQLIEDFASRSLEEMTAKAKELMKVFYAENPKYSYWNGCSTGGRQGLMLAQRLPGGYDGILAGAPAINWDRFIPAELWPQIVMKQEAGGPIAASKLNAATNAAIVACDSFDGVIDGVLENPLICKFDPVALQCTSGAAPDSSCLTPGEVAAVRKIWDGPRSGDGNRLWYGLTRGTPLAALAGTNPFTISADHLRYWLERDKAFDWHTLDYAKFDAAFEKSRAQFNRVIGSDDPDLGQFRRDGGKVLLWHGLSDQLIFPEGTIDYYERVIDKARGLKATQDFARLFLAPGVGHCGGGTGPSTFDMLGELVKWVESGQAPERIIASRMQNNPVMRSRPLCPYPKVATYTGTGSTDDAKNFMCETPFEYGNRWIK
jgi:pimeloyl-ACP methyl ester carboxylesterase